MKFLYLITSIHLLLQCTGNPLSRDDCHQRTFEEIKREIAGYSDIAKAIINLAVYGNAQNRSYERLARFVDTIGPRLSGSKNLEMAIKYMFSALQEEGLENVHLEPVKVPHWERGVESAMMLAPRSHSIAILGLGSSVATPPEGITAEVLVVTSFDELHKRAQDAKGKIVVYNQPYISYEETVKYRSLGAVEAGKVGAVASLIRSITSFSINSVCPTNVGLRILVREGASSNSVCSLSEVNNGAQSVVINLDGLPFVWKQPGTMSPEELVFPVYSSGGWLALPERGTEIGCLWVGAIYRDPAGMNPHTGWQQYQSDVPKIPTACISVEDAEMMGRMSSRGTRIVVTLKMGAKTYPDSASFNIVAEIVGSKYPEQVVLISGHLDSWDVGQGAMDDGGGAFISWEALSLIKELELRPKRTLRLVLWTAEEPGGVGAKQYYQLHKGNISNFDIVMESDEGTFMPMGLAFTGSDKARAILKEIMQLLQPINVTNVYENGGGTDIDYWVKDGVPGASLRDDISKYFWFHHSQGDTMTVQDPSQMNLCAAVWTVISYVIADIEERLPRAVALNGTLDNIFKVKE